MTMITIAQVREFPNDTPIPAISGTLTRLYNRTAGTNDNGDWSFQNGELSAGGDKIKIVFKDREEVPQSWKASAITVSSNETQSGSKGVKGKDDFNRKANKTERVVWVTGAATIVEGKTADESQPSKPPQQRQSSQPPASPPGDQSSKKGPRPEPPEVRRAVAQIRNYMKLCHRATMSLAKELGWDENTTSGHANIQSVRAQFFIYGTQRRRANDLDNLPDLMPVIMEDKKNGQS